MRLARAFLEQLQPDRAISGLALGWDTAWAIAAVEAKVPLEVVMPGKRGEQERAWDWGDQGTHGWLVRQSVAHSWVGGDLPFPKACGSPIAWRRPTGSPTGRHARRARPAASIS